MTPHSDTPNDAEVIAAFQDFIAARAEAGVLLAKAVESVSVTGDRVRVTINPDLAGAEYWALIETSPYENQAEFYGVPVTANDDDSIWLRRRVSHVEVADVDGRIVGAATSADLNRRA